VNNNIAEDATKIKDSQQRRQAITPIEQESEVTLSDGNMEQGEVTLDEHEFLLGVLMVGLRGRTARLKNCLSKYRRG